MVPETVDWLFWTIQVIMILGLLGLIVPIFPGIVVIWLASLGYGLFSGFDTLGWVLFSIITVLMIFGTLVDNLMMGAGARQGGAAWISIGVAIVAGILGTLLFPPLGGLLVAPVAVLLLEYFRLRDWRKAWSALRGLAVGWGLSVVVRFGIGLVMVMLWWVWVWKG